VYAAEKNCSMTQLMTQAIQNLLAQNKSTAAAKRRFLERARNAPDRGTKGRISWSREELHER
jgi:hypothetical protein